MDSVIKYILFLQLHEMEKSNDPDDLIITRLIPKKQVLHEIKDLLLGNYILHATLKRSDW